MNDNFPSSFRAAWWLRGPHAQTMWSTFFRPRLSIRQLWDRVELPDGDFIDLLWDRVSAADSGKPIVVLLHGLGGNLESSYVAGLMQAITETGWRPVLMHFRGSSGVPNRLARGYHSGETGDMSFVVNRLISLNPGVPVAALGISLGGNALLKWLGETGASNPLTTAIAISVPFVLEVVADRLQVGLSRLYQWYLISKLKKEMMRKFKQIPCPFDINILNTITNFWEFDDLITAPLHGFKDVHDYYKKSSCRQYLLNVSVPTLILHAKDDPFMTPAVIPQPLELSNAIHMELSEKGGHVGFIMGNIPGYPAYWLDKRVSEHLLAVFNTQ